MIDVDSIHTPAWRVTFHRGFTDWFASDDDDPYMFCFGGPINLRFEFQDATLSYGIVGRLVDHPEAERTFAPLDDTQVITDWMQSVMDYLRR